MIDKALRGKTILSGFAALGRIGVGFCFLMGSLTALQQPYESLGSIYSLCLFGPRVGMFVAMVLPWFSLLISLCLLGDIFSEGALLAVFIPCAVIIFGYINLLNREGERYAHAFHLYGFSGTWSLIIPCAIVLFALTTYIISLQLSTRPRQLHHSLPPIVAI
ncbi:MAG: hypothetical protein V1918_02255 [Planctomycetota bacterium]